MRNASKVRLNPGHVVVLEGLDKSGKSTQLDALRKSLDLNSVVFAHMPSGFTTYTRQIYDLLESEADRPTSDLARQLAHLSCHAESMQTLVDSTKQASLILDRWWWSTWAYGWFGGAIPQSALSEQTFRDLIEAVWAPIAPSIIFVFLTAHERDANNVVGVEAGYRALYAEFESQTVLIPAMDELETEQFIIRALIERGIAGSADRTNT